MNTKKESKICFPQQCNHCETIVTSHTDPHYVGIYIAATDHMVIFCNPVCQVLATLDVIASRCRKGESIGNEWVPVINQIHDQLENLHCEKHES